MISCNQFLPWGGIRVKESTGEIAEHRLQWSGGWRRWTRRMSVLLKSDFRVSLRFFYFVFLLFLFNNRFYWFTKILKTDRYQLQTRTELMGGSRLNQFDRQVRFGLHPYYPKKKKKKKRLLWLFTTEFQTSAGLSLNSTLLEVKPSQGYHLDHRICPWNSTEIS